MNFRRHKYGAKGVSLDGHWFPSQAEARRYEQLKLLERGGYIRNLELQPEFVFEIEGVKMFTYRADFRYFEGTKRVVEDVKGFKTEVYKIKKKIVEAAFKVTITEVAA